MCGQYRIRRIRNGSRNIFYALSADGVMLVSIIPDGAFGVVGLYPPIIFTGGFGMDHVFFFCVPNVSRNREGEGTMELKDYYKAAWSASRTYLLRGRLYREVVVQGLLKDCHQALWVAALESFRLGEGVEGVRRRGQREIYRVLKGAGYKRNGMSYEKMI